MEENFFNLYEGLPQFKDYKVRQVSSYDRSGGNNDFIKIDSGKVATLANIKGAGQIVRIWLTLGSADPYILRRALLKIYWDEEENPSVEVPLGDFFGTGFANYVHFTSLLLGMTSGGFYSYFPMPFASSARVEVENQSPLKIESFYYALEYQTFKKLEENIGYFHAQWRREETKAGENYTILEAKGRGHYLGCNLSMQGRIPFYLWFLEGDEMIYVDEEDFPSIHGTGTEDYFNSGWYFRGGEFSAPFHGLTVKSLRKARISAYRFHLTDPFPFFSSIKVTLEHGGRNDAPGSDYSSVAYWYQSEPHYEFYKLPGPNERLPKDGVGEWTLKKGYQLFLRAGYFVWNNVVGRIL